MQRLIPVIRLILAAAAMAYTGAVRAGSAEGPVVVELFTSQGCYSCPPAEAFLGELTAREDVLPLEFHVDYWDKLVWGFAGSWKDPFSSPAHTDRQRDYNLEIRNTGRVYTPQMVIDGRREAIGSRRSEVLDKIEDLRNRKRGLAVSVSAEPGNRLKISLMPTADAPAPIGPAAIRLIAYIPQRTTKVERGENHGKILTNHNIVTSVTRIGDYRGGDKEVTASVNMVPEGQQCAIIVQGGRPGPVLGAVRCPMFGS